jgi:hypothetical protein
MAENKENLLAQLNLVTTAKVENGRLHRVRTVPGVRIHTSDGEHTPEEVTWFLENDRWERDVVSYCGTTFCSSHVNLGDAEAARMEAEDDEVLELVQRTSVTLADLYRKGRAKGVIAARSTYR